MNPYSTDVFAQLDNAVIDGTPCYAYRPPRGEMKTMTQGTLVEGIHTPGFVIWPFRYHTSDVFTILDHSSFVENCCDTTMRFTPPHESTPRDRHMENVRFASEFHRANGGKTVISRVLIHNSHKTVCEIFSTLCNCYPDAYVFMFSSRPTGTWVGASPELLLRLDGHSIHTMALAGTKAADASDPWDEKNIEEQAIVTQFILSVLSDSGLNPHAKATHDKIAGKVRHICTPLWADLPSGWSLDALHSLLQKLSPTPALGGLPREQSLRLIEQLETHDRGYYGGFCGHMTDERHADLFVNLRSGLLTHSGICLYLGGGITSRSIPQDEWKETERKATTMLQALSNTKNGDKTKF